jgi:hypothetical protein
MSSVKAMTKTRLLIALVSAAAAAASGAAPSQPAVSCDTSFVVLRGIVAASPGPDSSLPYGLMVTVVSSNAAGHSYVKAPQPLVVLVGSSTRISGQGHRSLADLNWPNHVVMTARPCSSKLARGATPILRVLRVTAG